MRGMKEEKYGANINIVNTVTALVKGKENLLEFKHNLKHLLQFLDLLGKEI